MKVVSSHPETNTLHVRFPDGRMARVTGLTGTLPNRGDVVLLGENRWEICPRDSWPESNCIGVVKAIIEPNSVAIEYGLSVKKIENPNLLELEIGSSVEYNELDGVISNISSVPIRPFHQERLTDERDAIAPIESPLGGLSFDDFGGYPAVIERARELIETQISNRDALQRIGARPIKGVLFTGPPGTGKTHLARIIASETDADFFSVSGPEIVSKWLGDTENRLRELFDAATNSKHGRAILFFDEIDSIAERRSDDSHEASRRLVAQFLTLLDGFDTRQSNVIVIAATNRIEALDPALTRPGRFDWEIEFGMPSLLDRLEILRIGTKQIRCDEDLPLLDVALRTHDWSPARLTSIWTEAALVAVADKRDQIAGEDIAQAFERVARRPERQPLREGR